MVTHRDSQQLRHPWACVCEGNTSTRLLLNLLGKMLLVIHLLTRAEKQVQLGTLISFLLVGSVPAATWSPLAEGGSFSYLGILVGISGL